MEKDIVPGLLELIEKEFDDKTYNSAALKKAIQALSDKKATYQDVNEFAIEIGEILAQVLNTHITVETLPNGKIYFNIADRIMNSTMQKNYDLITGYAMDVQTELNNAAGLRLKGQKSKLNQSRIDGIVERLSTAEEFEEIKWILDEPIKNFSQSIVDDMVRTNAEFQAKAGLGPKIIRKPDRNPCDWCKSLVGEYDYNEVSDQGNDVFRRHDYCRCTVTFEPRRGNSSVVHSGTRGSRKYVQDKYGGYELSKKARIKRAHEMAKTEKARRDAARKKRIDTWARKSALTK
jgi:hypothetical protein